MFKNLFKKKKLNKSLEKPIENFKKEISSYTNVGENIFPLIKSADDEMFLGLKGLVFNDLSNGLRVVFGINTGERFMLVDKDQLKKMNLTSFQILEVAFRNLNLLAANQSQVGIKDFSKLDPALKPFYTLKTTIPISPSLLLIDELWEGQLKEIVKDEEIIISMPSSDDIYFCSFKDEASFLALKIITGESYKQALSKGNSLSDALFMRKDKKWHQLAISAGDQDEQVTEPKTGDLLISNPQISDKMGPLGFSVILIVKSTDDFYYGIKINDVPSTNLAEVSDRYNNNEISVFTGGMVQPEILSVLYRNNEEVGASQEVIKNVCRSTDLSSIMSKYNDKKCSTNDMLIFKGYFGWKKHQLIGEMQSGGWLVQKATEEIIFDSQREELYASLTSNI